MFIKSCVWFYTKKSLNPSFSSNLLKYCKKNGSKHVYYSGTVKGIIVKTEFDLCIVVYKKHYKNENVSSFLKVID